MPPGSDSCASIMKLSILIVTYNSSRYITSCLTSIEKHCNNNLKKHEYEVIILDNDSQDDTIPVAAKVIDSFSQDIRKQFILKKNSNNAGFAAGVNIAATSAQGKNILLLNPDTELLTPLTSAVDYLDTHNKVAVVAGKIKKQVGGIEPSAGKLYTLFPAIIMIAGLEETLGVRYSPNKIQQVQFVSCGFTFIDRDIFNNLGKFDEDFFIYMEDMDFCYRLKKAGYKIMFYPDVAVVHASHGSSSRKFAIASIYKGVCLFHKKHFSYMSYLLIKRLLKLKAAVLVIIGRLLNNKYLVETYTAAGSACK